jgi:DNA-binding LytR/AlgR family response regulator
MKTIQCLVVDDEPLARELVAMYVSGLAGWEMKASCRSIAEAYEALFLTTLKNPPHVIFTTAYAEYAAKAFDLKAVDYLVKPITEERFRDAIKKVEQLHPPTGNPVATQERDHVFLKQDNKLVKVLFDDILYVEALKDFSKVFLKEKTMLASAHLKLMEDMLPQSRFLRVHRSFMVALNAITAVNGNVIEIGKQEIPIGTTYKEELMKRLRLS